MQGDAAPRADTDWPRGLHTPRTGTTRPRRSEWGLTPAWPIQTTRTKKAPIARSGPLTSWQGPRFSSYHTPYRRVQQESCISSPWVVPDYCTDGPHAVNLEGRASSGPYPALSVCEEGVLTSRSRNPEGRAIEARRSSPEYRNGRWGLARPAALGRRSGVPVLDPGCQGRMIRRSEGPPGC